MTPWSQIEGESDIRVSMSDVTCPKGHGAMVVVVPKNEAARSTVAWKVFNDEGEPPLPFCVICSGLSPLREFA